jgi:hypothetical protein
MQELFENFSKKSKKNQKRRGKCEKKRISG